MIKVLLLIHARDNDTLMHRCNDLVRDTDVTYLVTGTQLGNWCEVAFTGVRAEVELAVHRFVCGGATDAYVNTIVQDAEPVKPTESEFYAKTWTQKYRELTQLGCITPITSAVRAADEHMRMLTLQGNVPWVKD